MCETNYVPIARLAELREGRMRSVRLGEREIVLCRTRDGVFALDNVCTHAHSRMTEGSLRGPRLICALHGASFDVRDGHVIAGPATAPLVTHCTRIVDGVIEVAPRAEETR
jgi:nitrite reductase/ring-hydroxylating ferredoxin subunit